MEEILLIVTATAGILQIILFFKIWVMTNDVKSIKNKDCDLIKKAQLLSLKGDKKKAGELFYEGFLGEVVGAYNNSDSDYYYISAFLKIRKKYTAASQELGFGNLDFDRFDNKGKVASIFLTK